MSPIARISLLALISLCIASPASANRGKVTGKKAPGAVRAKATKTTPKKASARKPTTTLGKTQTSKAKPQLWVTDKASVTKADTAVIAYLAKPLSLRGPKAKRLDATAAKASVQKTWSITDTVVFANADPAAHPITGNATVIVSAQRSATGRIGKALKMTKKREFIVNIGTDGGATVVGERSGNKAAKLLRSVNERMAVGRVVKDVLKSSGVKNASAGMGVVALAVLAGNSGISEFATQMTQQLQILGPAILTASAISAKNGMGRRSTARLHAFEQLTQGLDKDLKAGKTITVEAAYSRFQTALKTVRIGNQVTRNVQPPSREHFVKALAAWEVGRAQ